MMTLTIEYDPERADRRATRPWVRFVRSMRRSAGIVVVDATCENEEGLYFPSKKNHWQDEGTLIVEEKTMFHQVGWRGQSGEFYANGNEMLARAKEDGGYSPVFEQIAKWKEGEGWDD